jgi:hypothetical protein
VRWGFGEKSRLCAQLLLRVSFVNESRNDMFRWGGIANGMSFRGSVTGERDRECTFAYAFAMLVM